MVVMVAYDAVENRYQPVTVALYEHHRPNSSLIVLEQIDTHYDKVAHHTVTVLQQISGESSTPPTVTSNPLPPYFSSWFRIQIWLWQVRLH